MQFSVYNKTASFAVLRGAWLCLLLIAPQLSWAAGTPSGTSISNTATVTYVVGASPVINATSNTLSFLVDKKVNLLVTEVTGSSTSVNIGQTGAVTTFSVTNSGNDPQGFILAAATAAGNPAPGGTPPFTTNDFTTTGLQVFVDSNSNGIYEPGIDTATDIPTLASGASQTVFVIANIPGTALIGQQSVVSLAATAVIPGTMVALVPSAGGNTPGVEVLFADGAGVAAGDIARDAKHSAYGAYLVGGVNLVLTKTSGVVDPNGGTVVMPKAVITYQISVALTGTGTATNLVITDPLPPEVAYVTNSIIVDGAPQTDAVDPPTDNTDFGITNANSVTVNLGNVAAPVTHVITFRATIN